MDVVSDNGWEAGLMKRKNYLNIAKKFAGGIAVLGLSVAISNNAIAAATKAKVIKKETTKVEHKETRTEPVKSWDLGRGWKLNSTGGLVYHHPNDARYWFKLTGALRLDETLFMGSYADKRPVPNPKGGNSGFTSGATVRTAELYFDGGLGEDWEYTMTLSFRGNEVEFGDTWVSYSGLFENNQVFVGRVPGSWFGLDNSNSSSWNPFLERSLVSGFYPGDGLGVMTDFWWDNGGLTLTAAQPDQGDNNLPNDRPYVIANDPNNNLPNNPLRLKDVRDRWRFTARATFAPLHEAGDVWHFGVSGAWKEYITAVDGIPAAEFEFGIYPAGGRARNTTFSLVSTGSIRANNARFVNVEMARQCGPFMLEGEYAQVFVHRIQNSYGVVQFNGWNIQTRYLLTGEHHEYDVRDGNFGSVKPINDFGAFEVAARYDSINLNSKDIRGGSAHNVTVGFNWFLNQSLRLSANYVRSTINPANNALKRDLDVVGLRCQVRFK
jgi:phosphate-selective porin OprO/OprP